MEESLSKFMTKSTKRHEENSNIIKENRASTDAAIKNQGGSIKTLELQIGQMSKVLQERESGLYAVLKEARGVKILKAYDHNLPQKEKDPRSFTLPYFINNVCFNKALVDLEASVSVMPFSTYTNLGLGVLSHTRLTIELADRTIKQPRGIAKNVLVRIGKFVFPIDFIILDIPEDDDVPLILERPFLSTAHVKIDTKLKGVILDLKRRHLKLLSATIRRIQQRRYGVSAPTHHKNTRKGSIPDLAYHSSSIRRMHSWSLVKDTRKTKTFEENCYLLPYTVSNKEDTAYQRQLITRIHVKDQFLIWRITLHPYAVCTAGH
ncbi:ribonuclease H-like domain-containing protein [Tanacetum coccineum]